MSHRIYLAGPLFSRAEIEWAGQVKHEIERLGLVVVWPHEISSGSAREIFSSNRDALQGCDIMVAILDGAQVDDGTAWEVGYHYARRRPILGIRTDFRRAGERPGSRVNAMVECACTSIAGSLEELISNLSDILEDHWQR